MTQGALNPLSETLLCAQLNLAFDVQKLCRDLEAAQKHFSSTAQVGPYHDGSWRGITLRSFKGNLKPFSVIYQGEGENTEVMQYCPYFQEMFEHFPCPINTARLLFLPPKKIIGKHRDYFSINTGLVRLHIPIVTHEKVIFKIGEHIMRWKAGELWFGDFSHIHSVENQSDITRVHLVLDCTMSEALLALFPKPFLDARKQQIRLPLARYQGETQSLNSAKLNGYFKLPVGIIRPHLPLIGKIESTHTDIEIQLLGAPIRQRFIPVGEQHYAFIDFELLPQPDGAGFQLRNANRNFSADFILKKELNFLEKCQVAAQQLLGKTLYGLFHAGVTTSHLLRKFFKPAA